MWTIQTLSVTPRLTLIRHRNAHLESLKEIVYMNEINIIILDCKPF